MNTSIGGIVVHGLGLVLGQHSVARVHRVTYIPGAACQGVCDPEIVRLLNCICVQCVIACFDDDSLTAPCLWAIVEE